MSLTLRGGRGRGHRLPRPCSVASFPAAGASGLIRKYGRYLGEPRLGEARTVPHRFSALALLAACEGGARPGPGLPCSLRRGHGHQLFARFLLQVRAGVEGLGHPTARGSSAWGLGVHGGQVVRWFWSLGLACQPADAWRAGLLKGSLPCEWGVGVSEIGMRGGVEGR